MKCPTCGKQNQIVNQCHCDPNNLPTPCHTPEPVCVQLCRSNSIGNLYRLPTVISWKNYTPEEADELLAKPMVNNFFYRRYQ